MTVSLNWLLGDPSEIYWSSEAETKSELTIHKEVEMKIYVEYFHKDRIWCKWCIVTKKV